MPAIDEWTAIHNVSPFKTRSWVLRNPQLNVGITFNLFFSQDHIWSFFCEVWAYYENWEVGSLTAIIPRHQTTLGLGSTGSRQWLDIDYSISNDTSSNRANESIENKKVRSPSIWDIFQIRSRYVQLLPYFTYQLISNNQTNHSKSTHCLQCDMTN